MKKKYWLIILIAVLLIGVVLLLYKGMSPKFAREVPEAEKNLRQQVLDAGEAWLGAKEKDGSHHPIVDIYNSHLPLARGYEVLYTDDWCSVFVSTVAIQAGLTDYIPTECGCEPQINLFRELGAWVEADDYVPLPGDYIFYHWDCTEPGDCVAWSDHVGIVVGTVGPYIKVLEGNCDNRVAYRYVRINGQEIRGFGIPDYAGAAGI